MAEYWVDCDFGREARRAGKLRGCRKKPREYWGTIGKECPIWEETYREFVIPKGEWNDLYEEMQPNFARNACGYTYDQNGYGTCTSNQCSQGIAYLWNSQFGHDLRITPAPPSMYGFCASGGNSGSSVSCNLKRARDHGVLLINNSQNKKILNALGLDPSHVCDAVQWNAGKRLPDSYYRETASQFKIEEYYECGSVEAMISAVFAGFTVGYGRSGHSIIGVEPHKKDGQWGLRYHNSWGNWGETVNGLSGYGFDSESYLKRARAAYGAYAYIDLIDPDNLGDLIGAPDIG